MRILFVGAAAVALSGCSWLGLGNNYGPYSYNTGPHSSSAGHVSTGAPQHKPLSKWGITGAIGTDFIVGGNAVTGNDTGGLLNVHQVSMKNAYKPGYRGEAGITYALNGKQSLTINGFYQEAKGKSDVVFANAPGQSFTTQFGDYKAYGIDAGLRHNLSKGSMPLLKSVQPYVEGRIGIARTSDFQMENVQLNGVALVPSEAAMYEGRYIPTASALVGFEKPISRHMSIGLETGIRYMGKSDSDDSFVAGTALEGMNNGSSRWSIPLQIRGRYRF